VPPSRRLGPFCSTVSWHPAGPAKAADLVKASAHFQPSGRSSSSLVGSDFFAMPQPVHFSKLIGVDFRKEALMERPKLAAYIASISAHWNEIDARIAVFVAALLGSEAKTVISVFLALRSDTAKNATIDTIASLKLSPADLARFQIIRKNIGSRYSERNTAIHGSWGISPCYPDKLLWSDVRDTTAQFADLMPLAGPEKRDARLLEEQKKLMVYGESDFIAIIKRLADTYEELRDFTMPFIKPYST
jgi:hypothetical protein